MASSAGHKTLSHISSALFRHISFRAWYWSNWSEFQRIAVKMINRYLRRWSLFPLGVSEVLSPVSLPPFRNFHCDQFAKKGQRTAIAKMLFPTRYILLVILIIVSGEFVFKARSAVNDYSPKSDYPALHFTEHPWRLWTSDLASEYCRSSTLSNAFEKKSECSDGNVVQKRRHKRSGQFYEKIRALLQ